MILLGTYRNSKILQLQALLCGWLLLLSLLLPYSHLSTFTPELWKPIFPFQGLPLNETVLVFGTWIWRASLALCLILPVPTWPLLAATIISFAALALRNCFGLQIQLFAPLEQALVLLSVLRLLKGTEKLVAFGFKLAAVLLFFSAGVAKLRWSGLSWSTSGVVGPYLGLLLPLNSDGIGQFSLIFSFRQSVVQHPAWVDLGSMAVHLFEITIPLALFSRRLSRFFLFSSAVFLLSNFVALGINFFSILPLLLVWGLYDVNVQDLYGQPRLLAAPLCALMLLQLSVTLFSSQNFWPIMMNDMYAKRAPLPPIQDLRIEGTDTSGATIDLRDNSFFRPLTRFHIFVALFREPSPEKKNQIIGKVLANLNGNTSTERHFVGLRALLVSKDNLQELARSELTAGP